MLRLATPTANMWRVATRDTDINGVPVKAGSMLQIRYSSANRDEDQFEAPQEFDVTRDNARSNIAFGHGVHMCIGANLARKEMETAFRVLLERLDNFELDCDEADLNYPPNVLLRGLSTGCRFDSPRETTEVHPQRSLTQSMAFRISRWK